MDGISHPDRVDGSADDPNFGLDHGKKDQRSKD
jgi:hypothetical protein